MTLETTARSDMQPIRVLVLAPTPFFGDRGCHVRIYEQTKALRASGLEVLIVTYPQGRVVDVPTRRARRIPCVQADVLGPSLGRPLLDASVLLAARQAVKDFRPHIVHAHLHEGIAIGRALRRLSTCPLIGDIQGSLTEEMVDHGSLRRTGPVTAGVRKIEGWLARQPDRVLVSSPIGGALLREQGVAEERITLLPDGVDLELFAPRSRPEDLVERFGVAEKRVVVFLGVLTEYQGVDALLAAVPEVAQRVPDVHFLVMGYPNEAHYRGKVRTLGLQDVVTCPGRVPYEDAARWLSLGDVGVSPKKSLTEANGKLLAYMGCALPVVASDTPINRDLLGEAGWYAPVGDAGALASAITGLLLDEPRGRRLGASLRHRAETMFAAPLLADRLHRIYQELRPDLVTVPST